MGFPAKSSKKDSLSLFGFNPAQIAYGHIGKILIH
jgi:hypothetical protein